MTAAITLYACSPVENTADSVKNPAVLTPDITNVPQEQAESQQDPVDITGEPDNEITSENEFYNPQADAFAERISQEI